MTPEELKLIIDSITDAFFWTSWIHAGIAVFAAFGIYIGLWWRDDRYKNRNTAEILGNWSEFYQEGSDAIRKKCPTIASAELNDLSNVLTRAEAKSVCTLECGEEDQKFRSTIIRMLNKLEYICILYNKGMLKRKMFDEEADFTLCYWYDVLKNFIDEECLFISRTKDSTESIWPNFCGLVQKYKAK